MVDYKSCSCSVILLKSLLILFEIWHVILYEYFMYAELLITSLQLYYSWHGFSFLYCGVFFACLMFFYVLWLSKYYAYLLLCMKYIGSSNVMHMLPEWGWGLKRLVWGLICFVLWILTKCSLMFYVWIYSTMLYKTYIHRNKVTLLWCLLVWTLMFLIWISVHKICVIVSYRKK